MKSTLRFILIVFYCFLLSSCASNVEDISLPSNLSIPENSLNKDLRVIAPTNWNDFKKEKDFISLEITLVTNKQIVVHPDFNAEIYLFDETIKEWKKIENYGNYTASDEIVLRQGDSKGLAVLPDLSQASSSQNKLLILVSGYVIEDGVQTNQLVGTYIILKLRP